MSRATRSQHFPKPETSVPPVSKASSRHTSPERRAPAPSTTSQPQKRTISQDQIMAEPSKRRRRDATTSTPAQDPLQSGDSGASSNTRNQPPRQTLPPALLSLGPRFTHVRGFPAKATKLGSFDPPLDFLTRSPWQMPTTKNRIENFDPNIVARDALETAVILHPCLPSLITTFLRYKRLHGSPIEKDLYADMAQPDFVARLIKKRPLHFVNASDYTVLRDLTDSRVAGVDLEAEWLRVGTGNENKNKHIKLQEYLSYDEMMVASLIGTSGPSFIINTGDRFNKAEIRDVEPHEDRGVMVGLVGARLHKYGQMDHALLLPALGRPESSHFRQQDPALTKIFRDFFGAQGAPQPAHFDIAIYKARMRLSIETFLLEADDRAAQAKKTAYAHLVGLGLGVWKHHDSQQTWYVEVLTDCLAALHLKHMSTVEVAWIKVSDDTMKTCADVGMAVGIQVLFNKRPPFAKLDTGELVVRSWAWDSNTLPGNEYWSGIFDDSDDPAAVGCSTIAELHNPCVNPFEHRIKILQDRSRY